VFIAPTALPEDPATLQQILRAALAEIERLRLLIAGLQRNRFGRRSERLDEPAFQQGVEDLEQSLAEQAAKLDAVQSSADTPAPEATPRPRRAEPAQRNRGALPAHLPRVELVVDVEDKACPCCGGTLHVIGEDRAEMLDYVPAQVRVRVIRRPRYGCRACEVTVTRLDRLARSTRDLLNTLAAITDRKAGFRSLSDAWADTTTAHGRLMLTVLGGLAEFERELIRARTSEGRARAKANGKSLGRPFKLTPHQRSEAIKRRDRGEESQAEIGRSYRARTFYRLARARVGNGRSPGTQA
jgi:hypothetical protein